MGSLLMFDSCPEERACKCHVFGMGECEEYFELEGGTAVG